MTGGPAATPEALLVPIEASLDDIPAINISSDGEAKLRNGNEFRLLPHEMQDFQSQRSELQGDESDDRMALAMSNGQALAMGEIRAGFFRPFRVFQIG